MSRAVISLAIGEEHNQIAELTWPRMRDYAARHGAAWVPYTNVPMCERPCSWRKLVCIAHAFAYFEEVLWLDTDVVLLSAESIFDAAAGSYFQAMVEHKSLEGSLPNCGVWLLRRPMLPYLMKAAMDDAVVHHKWWEQAAIHRLMGYEPVNGVVERTAATPLYRHTFLLPERWNVCQVSQDISDIAFIHTCGLVGEHRLNVIKEALSL